jgi:hypothetical protein
LASIDTPGGVTTTQTSCDNSQSTSLISDWEVSIHAKTPNSKKDDCNNICDAPTKAIERVLYPSRVNNPNNPNNNNPNNPNRNNNNSNDFTYYQVNGNYLNSRCKSFPENFTILDCSGNSSSVITNINCKQTYKYSNPQFIKNNSVKSSTQILRKKYNTLKRDNGCGLSNFDNQLGGTLVTAARTDNPFLLKTNDLTDSHSYCRGAKINPVKCDFGLYRKRGNFVTGCMNNRWGKTIGHMQLNVTPNKNIEQQEMGFFSTNRQHKIKKSSKVSPQLTIAQLTPN